VRTPPIQPLTFDQARALLTVVKAHRWEALYWLALNLGMRQGELLGLTWDALNVDTGTLRVSHQLQRVKQGDAGNAFVLQNTKTKAGERILQLDADLIALLRERQRLYAEDGATDPQ
jgi:integrase